MYEKYVHNICTREIRIYIHISMYYVPIYLVFVSVLISNFKIYKYNIFNVCIGFFFKNRRECFNLLGILAAGQQNYNSTVQLALKFVGYFWVHLSPS